MCSVCVCVCVCTERPYLHWLPGLVGLAAAAAAVSHQLWFLPIPLDSHIYYIKIFKVTSLSQPPLHIHLLFPF